jgi:hypothetical protein
MQIVTALDCHQSGVERLSFRRVLSPSELPKRGRLMSRRVLSTLSLGICVFALNLTIARGGIVSDFSTGDESWRVVSFENLTTDNFTIVATYNPTFNFTGGNPGEYISTTDQDNGDFTFSAPAKFLGNVSGATGLSYDLIYPVGAINYQPTDVILMGNGETLL